MNNGTAFYILGLGLVAAALIVSFVGLRFNKFPTSRTLLIGGVAVFALLVAGTTTFAWRHAVDDQHERDQALTEATAHNQAAGNTTEANEEAGSVEASSSTTSTSASTTTAPTVDGSQVFVDAGCSGCHTLAAAGSTAQTGPDLDGVLKKMSAAEIKTDITDPNATIAKGYPPNVMPQDFGTRLSPEELDAVVQYLVESTHGKGSS